MAGWKIKTDVAHGETPDALATELADAELDAEDHAQADTAIGLAVTALSLVGDAAVDPSVKVELAGEPGEHVTVSVKRVEGKGAKPIEDVPTAEPEEVGPHDADVNVTPGTVREDGTKSKGEGTFTDVEEPTGEHEPVKAELEHEPKKATPTPAQQAAASKGKAR